MLKRVALMALVLGGTAAFVIPSAATAAERGNFARAVEVDHHDHGRREWRGERGWERGWERGRFDHHYWRPGWNSGIGLGFYYSPAPNYYYAPAPSYSYPPGYAAPYNGYSNYANPNGAYAPAPYSYPQNGYPQAAPPNGYPY